MTADARGPVLFVATLTAFVTPFMASSVNIALPTIGREFQADAVLLSWVATGYILAAAVFLLPFGRLGDLYGRRRLFVRGILSYTAASALCGLAPTAGWLIALRALQGAGAAMIFGTGMAMLTSVFPPGERGKALGLNVAATYIGLAVGPSLGGVLTHHFGWRSLFLVNIPLGLTITILLARRIRGEWAEARGERFDLLGTFLLSGSLCLLMVGFPQIGGSGGWLALLGTVGLGIFVAWEWRVAYPLLDVRLFAENPVFAFSNLAALINYSATFAVTFLLSLYLQIPKALTPQGAGLILMVQPAMMALCSPFAGRLSDRVEPRTVASTGMAFTAAGLAILTSLTTETSLAFVVATLVILGVGFGLFSSPNTNAVMSSVDRRVYGVASATLGTMRLTGQMVSMGIASLIFALVVGRVPLNMAEPAAFLKSLRIAFAVCTALCCAGIFASLARGRLHSAKAEERCG